MEPFPHLKFVQTIVGRARLNGGGRQNPISEQNKINRVGHSTTLMQSASSIRNDWRQTTETRRENFFAPLEAEVVPIFLQINPDLLNAEFDLKAFGIEVISEEDDGFIIGASMDQLRSLEDKIILFANGRYGGGKIADLWQIIVGNRNDWKKEKVLSPALLDLWSRIGDEDIIRVEVSIAFDKPLRAQPDPTKQGGERRLEEYHIEVQQRDQLFLARQDHFENYISVYGRLTSGIIELQDSFGCEVEITGKGFKDLAVNYPFVFEINEIEQIAGEYGEEVNTAEGILQIQPPENGTPVIGVIDSGIMEGHRYLAPALDQFGINYVSGNETMGDEVVGGGHGTRVAGAILYPLGISEYQSPYRLPFFIRNLKVLNNQNSLEHRYPAELIRDIVADNAGCEIFNLSICSKRVHRKKHMSVWAAWIDQEISSGNKMFVISSGNVARGVIREYIANGIPYPEFLKEPFCGIANPAQSCFALTVGSINNAAFEDANWASLGLQHDVSPFSRIGPGIWGTFKPDVVEVGGGYLLRKTGNALVRIHPATSPELLRSTLDGGGANGFDAVGTSYSAPKVTHIVGILKKLYPNETVNLLRALVVQGARLPGNHFSSPTSDSIRYFGYGLPSLERVIQNNDHRVTFYSTGNVCAEEGHIYSLKIPESLRNPGDEFDILIEVTLAYTAKIRRTRQKVKSYLSTWLSWQNSKLGESLETFRDFALKSIEGEDSEYDSEERSSYENIQWKIGDRINTGIEGLSRSKNTIQKDWAVIKSFELPEILGFAVTGHKGWNKNKEGVPYALVVSLEILGHNVPIYEEIKIENEVAIEEQELEL